MRKAMAPGALVALVACGASPSADPASGERLAVLEAEVGAIKKELHEVRLRTVPTSELSDAEFEEVLTRDLAKLKPEERAEREKSARSLRFMEELGEEGIVRYWLQKFERQKRDEAWAGPVEAACLPLLQKQASWKLHRFECRAELCKAELTTTGNGDGFRLVAEACGIGRLGGGGPTSIEASGMMTVLSSIEGDGVRTVVFVVRPGADMIPVPEERK